METMTMNFYRHMDRSLVQFDFLLHRQKKGDYEAEARSLGARIFRVPRQNPLSLGYWRALNQFFLEHPYQVVHAQLDCMSAEPLAAASKHGCPVRIAHSHSSRQDRDFKYPLKMMCKPFIKHTATDLFACGVEAGQWMFGTDNFHIVRNAVDVDKYSFDEGIRAGKRLELGIEQDVPVIGHVGRFDQVKNQSFLIDIFSVLLTVEPNALLLLVGDGKMRPKLEERVVSLGLEKRVCFLGLRSDVPELMQAMDVFCLPSLYEGLPLVLVEAQASGLPCLASDAVPCDCDFDGGVVMRRALADGAQGWAETLRSLLVSTSGRLGGADVVRRAGFDLSVEAAWLQNFYLKRAGGKS